MRAVFVRPLVALGIAGTRRHNGLAQKKNNKKTSLHNITQRPKDEWLSLRITSELFGLMTGAFIQRLVDQVTKKGGKRCVAYGY